MQMLEGHRARKRFGQNFLHDEYWISRIARAVDAQPGEFIVEIGPGQAALTRELVGGAGHVNAVEIDRDLAAWLKTQFAESELTLIEADALTLDWTAVAGEKRMRVVGNLPYNISSPLLFHLMKAAPGTKTYGRLSVMLQWRYKMHKLFDVPPGAFTPAPKVVSSVVRMIPRRAEEVLPVDFDMLSSVVANAFGQRRKTLRNALSVLLTEEEIRAAGVDPQERAEKLPLIHFVNLANKASELKRKPVIQGAQASDE